MPKTIVIFCKYFQNDKSPFNSDYYWHAYIDLFLLLKKHGADTYFAADNATYKGNGLFSVAYTADSKIKVSQFRRVENITADIIYDKGSFIRVDDTQILNPDFVHTIAANKSETYKHFSQYQPLSILCTTKEQAFEAIDSLSGTMAVIKTLTGNGGNGVRIEPKVQVLQTIPTVYPILVQEFIDTSVGIKDFVEGYHDLRLKIGGGEIWGGTLRTPAEGEYRANVAQGGTERHLFPWEIPEVAQKLALEIDKYFKDYPRYYAIDFANTTQGWKLIELNSKPGLSPIHLSEQSKNITDRLARYLISLA